MKSQNEKYYELSYYTLAHPEPSFIHQYIVDAFTAQNADKDTKPIALAFALIGLYLHLEKKYSGKEVQKAHMQLAKMQKTWPSFEIPKQRGDITVSDVLEVAPGPERDQMIEKWTASVWSAYEGSHQKVIDLLIATDVTIFSD